MNRLYQITVTNPCHVGWDQMAPNEQGRHCSACSKTVIDFTNYSDQEIADYFIARNGQNVCGRILREQVARIRIEIPDSILTTRQPYWRKFLIVCMLVFGTSVFPFETALSQTIIASIITEPAKDNQKKKKIRKTKKKKSKETTYAVKEFSIIMGNMTGRESIPPYSSIECKWAKPDSSSKNLNEDSLVATADLPQKDKNPDQPSEKGKQFIIPSQPYQTRRSPKKKP